MTGFDEVLRSISFSFARFSGFAANAVIFGLVPILLVVVRPAFANAPTHWDDGRRRLSNRLEWLVQACLVAAFAATVIVLVLEVILLSELEGGALAWGQVEAVLETSFGRWVAVRLPVLGALAVLLWGRVRHAWMPRGAHETRRGFSFLWWGAWGVLALALLATNSFGGHAAVATPRAAAVVNDVIHLGAGATWFAGIVVLAAVLPDAWRRAAPVERLQVLAPAVSRFSRVALISIGVVAVTGTINSFLHVGAADDLVDSGYGRALATKVALFVGVLVIGGINHLVIRRRLEAAAQAEHPATAQRSFRRTIAAELVFALAVMAATGVLVGMARTKEAAPVVGTPMETRRVP